MSEKSKALRALGKKLTGKEIGGGTITKILKDITSKYSGGGGGTEIFIVNITYNEEEDEYITDKTCTQIVDAYNAGKILQAVYNSKVYPIFDVPRAGNSIVFKTIWGVYPDDDAVEFSQIDIDSDDNSVSMSNVNLANGG